eukprot:jgi/Psemu1/193992/e_gw1.151.72.1
MLRVTPLYGSRWETSGAARSGSCTLVEYADVRVLVDTTESATVNNTDEQSNSIINNNNNKNQYTFWENLPPHDCLVLTDSTLESMGSLPLYILPPIFATFPTVKMGQMTLYDHHANLSLDGGRPPYTLEEMDRAIARLRTIKYSQMLTLPLPVEGASASPRLSVTAHRAGHVVGGAFYRLERLRDETSVVVTGNAYHIARELHLDACTLLQKGTGADVLVTRPGGPAFPLVNGLYSTSHNRGSSSSNNNNSTKPPQALAKRSKALRTTPLASRARRDLTERILGFLRRDANVLLPVDASGRALELVLLLNRFWAKENLGGSYNLVWFGSMVRNTLEFGRSQLEWMNSALGNHIFESTSSSSSHKKGRGDAIERGKHPYLLKHVTLCTNLAELDKVLADSNDNPTCVLANGLTLDHGPARDLFLRWADNDNNAVIFTDTSRCLQRFGQKQQDPKDESTTVSGSGNTNSTVSAGIGAGATAKGTISSDPSAPSTAAADNEADDHGADDIEDSMMGRPLTEGEASPFTVAYQLLKHWALAQAEDREMDDVVEVDVLVPRRTPLVGNELAAFLEREEASRLARRKKEEEQAMLREVELAKGRLRLGEDSATSGGTSSATKSGSGAGEANPSTALASDSKPSKAAHLPFFRKKKSRFDSSLFLKFSKPLHLTFELREDAVGVGQQDLTARFGIGESLDHNSEDVLEDDYGISVRHEQFRDIVTGVDPSKFGAQKDEINKRGLGYAASGASAGGATSNDSDQLSKRRTKRRRKDDLGLDGDGGNDNNEDDDDMDERGMEVIDLSEGNGIIRGRNGRPPTKVSTANRRIEVVAEIDYIPFEGRVDSRAARQSVRALQPRQVVVLGGSQPSGDSSAMVTDDDNDEADAPSESVLLVDEVRALADAAQGFIVSREEPVRTPSDAETVELKVGHSAYPARLVATPFRTKEERLAEEEVPDPIELAETKIGACTVSLLDFVMTGQKVALDGSIVIAPKNNRSRSSKAPVSIFERERERPPVYVSDGEVLLTDLRTELIAQHGMKAEYSAHTGYSQLIVNGRIVVKKWSDGDKAGKIDVEGPLCEDFFAVRSVVCGQYVTL